MKHLEIIHVAEVSEEISPRGQDWQLKAKEDKEKYV
jgi:hypothetical protein